MERRKLLAGVASGGVLLGLAGCGANGSALVTKVEATLDTPAVQEAWGIAKGLGQVALEVAVPGLASTITQLINDGTALYNTVTTATGTAAATAASQLASTTVSLLTAAAGNITATANTGTAKIVSTPAAATN